jgi:hypothetical protein
MCWSATADLLMGGAVSVVGVAALASVRRPAQLPLAALPLLLGLHQLIEATVWWGEDGHLGASATATARTLWAVIAFPLLPALVPLAVLLVVEPARRLVVAPFALVGLAVSALLAGAVARGPVTAEVLGHTLRYGVGVPQAMTLGVFYVLATTGSLIASGQRGLRPLGVVCGIGALICLVLWQTAFVSTWCALAAVCSLLVLRWLRTSPERTAAEHTEVSVS